MIDLRRTGRNRKLVTNTALAMALVAGCAGIGQLALAESGPQRSDRTAAKAVASAEKQVARNPQDAGLRAALGRAYLAAGRFESAADMFAEAAELGKPSGPVALSHALAQIGEGRMNDAIATLGANRDRIPAGDYGLALALAGDTARGVAILEDAVRGGDNTAKLRQNLAYAYALDGRWREARTAAAQDVPLAQVGDRMSAWAAQARPEAYRVRVATLLGVPLRADIGRPEALALVPRSDAAQLAVAEPLPLPLPLPVARNGGELPAIDGTPAAMPADPAPAPAAVQVAPVDAEPAPVPATAQTSTAFAGAFEQRTYVAQPVVQAVPSVRTAAAAVRPAGRTPRAAQPALRSGAGSTHLVQLGSFSTEERARKAWSIYLAGNPELRAYRMAITPAVVKGRNYWRVAAAGFDARGATGLCSSLRGRGSACFAYAASRPWPGVMPMPGGGQGAMLKARR